MLRRVEWSAVWAVAHEATAFALAAYGYWELAVVVALGGVMWAIFSLKERT